MRQLHVDTWREVLLHGEHPYRATRRASYSESTVARKLTAVSSWYRYVLAEAPHLVAANPVADVKRPEVSDESSTVGLTADQAAALLVAAETAGRMEYALVALMLSTGLRVSEVCHADTADLGREHGLRTLTVKRKGGRRQRTPLPADAAAALEDYLDGRTGPLFLIAGARIVRHQVFYRLRKLATAAGIDPDLPINPHSLRHTATTQALDEDESLRRVQMLMGHRDPRTTTRYDRARDNVDRSPVHALGAAYRRARERRATAPLPDQPATLGEALPMDLL